jgi:hypothetical protein
MNESFDMRMNKFSGLNCAVMALLVKVPCSFLQWPRKMLICDQGSLITASASASASHSIS